MAEQFQRRDVLRLAAAGAALAVGGVQAQGSSWPTKPVTMVVPFPAGGGTDAFARPLSAQFGKVAGQTLVIDNRGGAGGTVGASIAAKGARIDAFYYCPHHPQGIVKELAVACRCRKPEPGMLEQAAAEWPLELSRSFLIGDKDDDMTAAARFGIRGIKFDARTDSLLDLVRREIARGAQPH